MRILVTGAKGFIGKNLVTALKNIMDKKDKVHNIEIEEIYEYDIDTEISLLDTYCQKCDFFTLQESIDLKIKKTL